MGLPVIEHPIFNITQPSTGKDLKFRPLLVKEEKILLMAQQSSDPSAYINGINQVLANCFYDCEPDKFPIPDAEFCFIQLRANSVSDVSKINVFDEDKEEFVPVDIDLTQAKVEGEFDTSLISITDDIKIQLRYPRYTDLLKIGDDENAMTSVSYVSSCIQRIYQGEEEFDPADYSDEELTEFLDSLPTSAWEKISERVTNYPRVRMEVQYSIKDGKKNVKKTKVLEGLNDFF